MSSNKKTAPAPVPAGSVVYRDSVYTSRVLILPGGRQLVVVAARVSVSADDAEALEYLNAHSDLKPLQE